MSEQLALNRFINFERENDDSPCSQSSNKVYRGPVEPSPDYSNEIFQIAQSCESLDILLPKLHAQTEKQTYWVLAEDRIMMYLRGIGLKFKTDPQQKEKAYTTQDKVNKIIFMQRDSIDEDKDEFFSTIDSIRSTQKDQPVGGSCDIMPIRTKDFNSGLARNKFFQRKKPLISLCQSEVDQKSS